MSTSPNFILFYESFLIRLESIKFEIKRVPQIFPPLVNRQKERVDHKKIYIDENELEKNDVKRCDLFKPAKEKVLQTVSIIYIIFD